MENDTYDGISFFSTRRYVPRFPTSTILTFAMFSWKDSVLEDLGHVHSSLQQALTKLALPLLPPLQSGLSTASGDPQGSDFADRDGEVPSCDNSPRISPREEGLAHAPIDSLYQITRLSALRSDASPDTHKAVPKRVDSQATNDFITRGLVSVSEAER